jgi:glycerophosphoryl diester phosphodiesterase
MLVSGKNNGTFPEIIAHRGASSLAPENTLCAVELAWKLNADAVEIDLRMTSDGRIVVIHDATTERTTGVRLVVSKTTSNELRKLDAGKIKSPEFAEQHIPFLEEVIATVPDGKKLFIEIKTGSEIYAALERTIKESGKISQLVILCFDLSTLSDFKALMPELPAFLLSASRRSRFTLKQLPHDTVLIEAAKKNNLDALNVQNTGITEDFIRTVKASGLKLYVWTVNDPEEAGRLAKHGVDGITTDNPDCILQNLH